MKVAAPRRPSGRSRCFPSETVHDGVTDVHLLSVEGVDDLHQQSLAMPGRSCGNPRQRHLDGQRGTSPGSRDKYQLCRREQSCDPCSPLIGVPLSAWRIVAPHPQFCCIYRGVQVQATQAALGSFETISGILFRLGTRKGRARCDVLPPDVQGKDSRLFFFLCVWVVYSGRSKIESARNLAAVTRHRSTICSNGGGDDIIVFLLVFSMEAASCRATGLPHPRP